MTDFYGLPTGAIENNHLRLEYLAGAGLRLVRLFVKGPAPSDNFLAETPQIAWPTPFGPYFLRGGHRLWHAPEGAPRSSIPEPQGLAVTELDQGVRLCQPAESVTGIRKSLEVSLHPDHPGLTLRHILVNEGVWPVELAPWAITQLALGGTALLPQTVERLDAAGLRPNHALIWWPYTRLKDTRLELSDDCWRVHGRPQLPPCKIGYLNRAGWLAYWRKEAVFVKCFQPRPELPHPDLNCNAEVYCDARCLELETLGPLCALEPGQSVTHVEEWHVFTGLSIPPAPADIQAWLADFQLRR